jgi:hypothetical protein
MCYDPYTSEVIVPSGGREAGESQHPIAFGDSSFLDNRLTNAACLEKGSARSGKRFSFGDY